LGGMNEDQKHRNFFRPYYELGISQKKEIWGNHWSTTFYTPGAISITMKHNS